MSSTFMPSMTLQDEGDLLYTTLVGMVMAALFATGFHDDVEHTVTKLAPEGTSYTFSFVALPSSAKFASAVAGFFLGVIVWTLLGAIRWRLLRMLLCYRDWLIHPKSTKTKVWILCLKVLIPRKRYLRSFQNVLPKYPLPKLSDTCKRTLEVYEPLLNREEFKQLKDDLDQFENTEGPMLHAMLEKRHETEENWLFELWDNYAYLAQRTPIVVNTSIGTESPLTKPKCGPIDEVKSAGRAANLAYGYITFWEMIKTNKLPALLVSDLVPICAERYRYIFACTRIPGVHMDELKCYEDSKHIVVIRKGQMYRLDVYYTAPSGEERILPAEEIQRQIEMIMDDSTDLKETVKSPALFTAQNRTQWAKDRERLQLKKVNATSLREVESAIFHIVMEDTSPETLADECAQVLCSTGYNLWCDKSITMRVFENSKGGFHFEHAAADGPLFARMFEFIWEAAKYDENGNAITGGDQTVFMPRNVNPPQRLDWDLSQFENVIPKYEADLDKLCNDLDMRVLTVRHGKGPMKRCRVSPDGLMQMALQLAFYRIHKTTPKTYESASTRFFKLGRTETIRPVSTSSVAFTKAMDDPNVSRSERARLCKAAISHQHNYKLRAMNGEACDRAIFGLYVAAKMAGIQPKVFRNKCLLASDQLSTSQSPYYYDAKILKRTKLYPIGGGFGPQRHDGYGVFYLFLADDMMTIHVSSFHSHPDTDSTRMSEETLKAIDDIKTILSPSTKQ